MRCVSHSGCEGVQLRTAVRIPDARHITFVLGSLVPLPLPPKYGIVACPPWAGRRFLDDLLSLDRIGTHSLSLTRKVASTFDHKMTQFAASSLVS